MGETAPLCGLLSALCAPGSILSAWHPCLFLILSPSSRWVELCPPKKDMFMSLPLVSVDVTLFGNGVFANIIT